MYDQKYLNATQNFKLNFSKTNFLIKKHKVIPNNLTLSHNLNTVGLYFSCVFVLLYRKETSPAVLCGVYAHVV